MFLHSSYQQLLLGIARESINYGLDNDHPQMINVLNFDESLREEMATFVTLKLKGQLRGCIGTTRAITPLVTSISDNAWSAAYHDPRFRPLSKNEFGDIHISISILTPSELLPFSNEADLLEKLRPGTDGLIIERQGSRATFLPAVWESLPDRTEFLAHLKSKAGMKSGDVPERAWIYQCVHFQEQE